MYHIRNCDLIPPLLFLLANNPYLELGYFILDALTLDSQARAIESLSPMRSSSFTVSSFDSPHFSCHSLLHQITASFLFRFSVDEAKPNCP